jgi:hypothetical protein
VLSSGEKWLYTPEENCSGVKSSRLFAKRVKRVTCFTDEDISSNGSADAVGTDLHAVPVIAMVLTRGRQDSKNL